MRTPYTLAAVAAGAFALSGAPALAQSGRMAPAQSLAGSCRAVNTLDSGYVTAECRDESGRYRWSSVYYPQCRTNLINRDGMLYCTGARTNGGAYVQDDRGAQVATAVIGAIAGALLGDNNDDRGGQWAPINQRQARLDARIDAGLRDRSLTRREAAQLRADFRSLERREAAYRRDGLSYQERADLDRRFDALSLRIKDQRDDGQTGWAPINQRQAQLDARIDAGVRDRSLTSQEAARLRSEFQALARLEASYRRGGLSNSERADLDRRFDMLSRQIKTQRADGQTGWTPVNQRQAQLDARIKAGLRDRTLDPREAARLRAEFQSLNRLEVTYRRDGLSNAEQADLDRRFNALSARIRTDRRD